MEEILNNLYFVLTHSAHNLPAAIIFAALGLWLAYVFWAEWARELRLETETQSSLLNQISNFSARQPLGTVTVIEEEDEPEVALPFQEAVIPDIPPRQREDHSLKIPGYSIFVGEEDYIEADEDFGVVYGRPPQHIDPLVALDGIDQLTSNKLNAAGIYAYKQLASFDDVQRRKLTTRFNLPEDIWDSWKIKLGLGEEFTETVTPVTNLAIDGELPDVFTIPYTSKGRIDAFGAREIANAASVIRHSDEARDTVQVEGYANVPGSEEFNHLLSQAWAQNVADHLVEEGVNIDLLEVTGLGREEGESSHISEHWVKIRL